MKGDPQDALGFMERAYWAGSSRRGLTVWMHRMNGALKQAIKCGLVFEKGDIRIIAGHEAKSSWGRFWNSHWIGSGGFEGHYATACTGVLHHHPPNLSAARSIEHHLGRKPFIFGGKRLYVGRRLCDNRIERISVSSFNDESGTVLLAGHEAVWMKDGERTQPGEGHLSWKYKRRWKLTNVQLQALEKMRKSGELNVNIWGSWNIALATVIKTVGK